MVESVKNHQQKQTKVYLIVYGLQVLRALGASVLLASMNLVWGRGFYMGHPAPSSSNELNHWTKKTPSETVFKL